MHVVCVHVVGGESYDFRSVHVFLSSRVDVVDQMKEEYSLGRMPRKWPMILFLSILNIAAINSQIIYKEILTTCNTTKIFENNVRHYGSCSPFLNFNSAFILLYQRHLVAVVQ